MHEFGHWASSTFINLIFVCETVTLSMSIMTLNASIFGFLHIFGFIWLYIKKSNSVKLFAF